MGNFLKHKIPIFDEFYFLRDPNVIHKMKKKSSKNHYFVPVMYHNGKSDNFISLKLTGIIYYVTLIISELIASLYMLSFLNDRLFSIFH